MYPFFAVQIDAGTNAEFPDGFCICQGKSLAHEHSLSFIVEIYKLKKP